LLLTSFEKFLPCEKSKPSLREAYTEDEQSLSILVTSERGISLCDDELAASPICVALPKTIEGATLTTGTMSAEEVGSKPLVDLLKDTFGRPIRTTCCEKYILAPTLKESCLSLGLAPILLPLAFAALVYLHTDKRCHHKPSSFPDLGLYE
jgi:hypothetical protein